jgi:type I restriction enzyme M protein
MEIQDIQSKLWAAADKLRGNINSSDYKYVVLGLIFLKYVSDAFELQYKKAESEDYDPEDRDFYLADNVFWIPKEARWSGLVENAKQPNIGLLVDEAMEAIERDNPTLKGVLPKNYAREALDKRRLGELIDLFTNISFEEGTAKDLLGQVYEYFMGMFADSEGKHGGEFYTPRSIVKLLVEMLEPYSGRVYDPACGSGGMFVWSEKFVEEHQGRIDDIAIYGRRISRYEWRSIPTD